MFMLLFSVAFLADARPTRIKQSVVIMGGLGTVAVGLASVNPENTPSLPGISPKNIPPSFDSFRGIRKWAFARDEFTPKVDFQQAVLRPLIVPYFEYSEFEYNKGLPDYFVVGPSKTGPSNAEFTNLKSMLKVGTALRENCPGIFDKSKEIRNVPRHIFDLRTNSPCPSLKIEEFQNLMTTGGKMNQINTWNLDHSNPNGVLFHLDGNDVTRDGAMTRYLQVEGSRKFLLYTPENFKAANEYAQAHHVIFPNSYALKGKFGLKDSDLITAENDSQRKATTEWYLQWKSLKQLPLNLQPVEITVHAGESLYFSQSMLHATHSTSDNRRLKASPSVAVLFTDLDNLNSGSTRLGLYAKFIMNDLWSRCGG